MAFLGNFITNLATEGRHHFTLEQATAGLGGSVTAARAALRRAVKRGDVASPHRGFFVIVPPEYRRLRCLPPEQFVPQLMKHLKETYYVALLSAAELHGAAHHRPQRFQVMTRKNRREIACGDVRVQFVARHDLERTPFMEMNTPRGRMRVSSKEATALELVGYADQCGGLSNVVAVLEELAESLEARELADVVRISPLAWSQRLGYLLETCAARGELLDALETHLRSQGPTLAPLVRSISMKGAPRAERWRLAINASVEADP